jgi:hypothetical protein
MGDAIAKFFRVLVEGDTIDGRKVSAQDIIDIAHTYDPDTYGARINLEHIRGTVPGGAFDRLGDVSAVRAQDDTLNIGGQPLVRKALYAQIAPLPALVAMAKSGQKVFTSAEIDRNFANTGKTGLVGVAVTDDPASLGTHRLHFSAQVANTATDASGNTATPSYATATSVFSAYRETALDFADAGAGVADTDGDADGADDGADAATAITRIIGIIGKALGFSTGSTDAAAIVINAAADPAPVIVDAGKISTETAAPDALSALLTNPAVLSLATRAMDAFDAYRTTMDAAATARAAELAAAQAQITALTTQLDTTPRQTFTRPRATGAEATDGTQTDC